jgi:hypothetical protein
MTKAEIIDELPRLSHHDRREILRELVLLEGEVDDSLQHARECADLAFRELDKLEQSPRE